VKLTPEVIGELVKVRADKKALETHDKELSIDIKAEMERREIAEYAPKESPYKLVLDDVEKSAVEWKTIAQELAEELWGERWMAKLEKKADSFGKKHELHLRTPANERYSREKNGKAVA
jgi:hypothetical protein